jgi:hypothetical protein
MYANTQYQNQSEEQLTFHAKQRSGQRSIPTGLINLVSTYADICHRTSGRGCKRITMSNKAHSDAAADGIPAQVLSRAKGVQLVLGGEGQVLTVYKCDTKRRSLKDRRQGNSRWQRF